MGQSFSRTQAYNLAKNDIGVPISCEQHWSENDPNNEINSFVAVVSYKWLQSLITHGKLVRDHDLVNLSRDDTLLKEIFNSAYDCSKISCIKIQIHAIKKDLNLYLDSPTHFDASMLDLLEMINKKERKLFSSYIERFNVTNEESTESKEKYNWKRIQGILKDTYNINVIHLKHNSSQSISKPKVKIAHLLPVAAVLESDEAVYIIEGLPGHSILDVLLYSPAVLYNNHVAVMFLFYQLLHCFSELTKLGFRFNETLTLNNVYVLDKSLWIGISPFRSVESYVEQRESMDKKPLVKIYNGVQTNLKIPITLQHDLGDYTKAWCKGGLSNFDYLIILNVLAGRKFGDPLNHLVFPWVTDFSFHFGGFRDLTKTKFRLNKGDRQLDATFSAALGSIGSAISVQHHVSDVLSDITYYIYRARNTTKNMLCSHVRSRWVPNEYPSSIERMYNWTPDECIPEFFYDPEVFKTIHDDLEDLRLPTWIATPEEFVQYHYQMLESKYVSEHLHHWIDLIFGFKLSGIASKKEKNVHLSLVDDHLDFKNYGIVQLFTTPHPKKNHLANNSDFIPSISHAIERIHSRDVSASWEYVDLATSMRKHKDDVLLTMDQEDLSVRKPTKILNASSSIEDDVTVRNVYDITVDIADMDFLQNLKETEAELLHELSIKRSSKDGIGTHKFESAFSNQTDVSTSKSAVDDNTKLLACLLMEIVLHKDLRIRTNVPSLDQRLEENLKFLNSNQHITSSVKYFLEDLLEIHNTDDEDGISPATPAIGFMSTKVKFQPYFKKVHSFLQRLYNEIRPYIQFPISVEEKMKLSNIIEKYVSEFELLLSELNSDGVNLLLLYLVPLFENSVLRIPMFIYFFSPLSISLGPARSKLVFLKELQKLFDSITITDEVELLQQSFLTKTVSSFGLDTFLQYIFKLVLDVLVTNDVGLYNQQRFRKSSTLSTSSVIEYKNESLISYEVSPCINAEVDSVSSLNLGNLFMDNAEEILMLSPDYTNSFTSESFSTLTTSIVNNDMHPTSLLSPSIVLIDSTMLGNPSKLPIHSSQEVQSAFGMESMIEIDTTTESLENFTNSNLKTASYQSSDSSSLRDNDEEMNVNKQAPFTILLTNNKQRSLEETEEVLEDVPVDENFEKINSKMSISAYQSVVESVKWLIPLLGPSLATEHVVKPLLRRLSKVVLDFDTFAIAGKAIDHLIQKTSPIIECLIEVALVYGDAVVLQLFLPKISHLIENATISSSVSVTTSSNLVTSVQLLMKASELLQPESILTHVEDFSGEFFQPLIRLLSTVKPFTTGSIIKAYLACKLIDTLGIFCKKLNREAAQDNMAPLLQQFFSCFDGIYALKTDKNGNKQITRKYTLLCQANTSNEPAEKKNVFVERAFSSFDEVDNNTFRAHSDRVTSSLTIDDVLNDEYGKQEDEKFADIYNTFSPSLAYHAYVLFCRVVGTHYIEKTLYNSDLVWHLFTKHDEYLTHSLNNQHDLISGIDTTDGPQSESVTEFEWEKPFEFSPEESESQRSSWQHIDGKWLEHWKNSQDLDQQYSFFSDLKLQTYAGHSSAIRDFYVPNNEHYFLSASRDKTVKLWLLKNHGNGTAHLGYARTYDQHTKAIFAVQGIESKRYVASCDGDVHVWDPVTGATICEFDAGRGNSFTSIRTLPAPSTCLAVATTEGSIRLYDVRQKKFAEEWKLSPQVLSSGMVRSMCCNQEGTWLASGLSSGVTVVLDVYAGVLKSQTRMHDSEIIQMVAAPGYGFISASADYTIRMWHEDGNVSHIAKTSNENIHTLVYNREQLLWATTNNKLCIYQAGKVASSHSYRIGQDSFKGNLSKLAILPVNRLYLCGADNGNVVLYA